MPSCSVHSSLVSLVLAIASQEPDQYAHQQDSDGGGSSQHAADDQGPPHHSGRRGDDRRLLLCDELVVRLPLASCHARGQDHSVHGVCVNGDVICARERRVLQGSPAAKSGDASLMLRKH